MSEELNFEEFTIQGEERNKNEKPLAHAYMDRLFALSKEIAELSSEMIADSPEENRHTMGMHFMLNVAPVASEVLSAFTAELHISGMDGADTVGGYLDTYTKGLAAKKGVPVEEYDELYERIKRLNAEIRKDQEE